MQQPTTLRISGEGIKLLEASNRGKPSYNVKRINLSPAKQAVDKTIKTLNHRHAYKVNVKNYTNADVNNKQLKEIYEAIEFEDFKRFLVKKRDADASNSIDLSNFYRDNYEVHYNLLKQKTNQHV